MELVWFGGRLSLGDKVRIRCSSMGKGTSNSVEYSMGKKVPTGDWEAEQVQRTYSGLQQV